MTLEESIAATLRAGDEKQLAPSIGPKQTIKPRSRCIELKDRIETL